MIRKALLFNPPTGLYVREDRCQSSVDDFAVKFTRPPMDLLTTAAYLESVKVEVAVRDYPMTQGTWETLTQDMKSFRPDVTLISVTASTLQGDMKACENIKRINPRVITCAKGVHSGERNLLKRYPNLDVILQGEHLASIRDIASGKPMEEICGIAYRKNGVPTKNQDCERLQDLDQLPMPALHLIDNTLYVRPDTGQPCAHIETSRGCPARCIYCLAGKIYGKRIRLKSPRRVVDEVERCINDFQIVNFHFKADTFTWNKKWVLTMCREIQRRNLTIEWFCNSRVDTLDEERIRAMKNAGCFAVGLGIESGSDEILNRIQKGTTIDQSRKAVELCRRYGVLAYTYFMIGFPWDTHETVRATIELMCELDGDFADVYIVYPFAETELCEFVREHGLLFEETDKGAYAEPALRTFHLTANDLRDYRRKGLLRFYLRPRYILRRLLWARNPRIMWNYLYHGAHLMKKIL